jgi:hypothetical protein
VPVQPSLVESEALWAGHDDGIGNAQIEQLADGDQGFGADRRVTTQKPLSFRSFNRRHHSIIEFHVQVLERER